MLTIRPAGPDDRDGAMRVAVRALGWSGDERDRAFFAWKHDENPFGPSPAWVACGRRGRPASGPSCGGSSPGARSGYGWSGRSTRPATPTTREGSLPAAHAGRGGGPTAAGYDAVFNTPNNASPPGLPEDGLDRAGHWPNSGVPPGARRGAWRMVRSRVPAEKWSEATSSGNRRLDALAGPALECTARHPPPPRTWSYPRLAAYLRWRYGFEPLRYRASTCGWARRLPGSPPGPEPGGGAM